MKADEKEILSVQEQMEETMFLGLRMMKGVGRKEFSECYGKELDEVYGRKKQPGIFNPAWNRYQQLCDE